MKTLAILLLAALPAMAQKPDELKQLKSENATLRIQLTNLQNALIQMQVRQDQLSLSEAHSKAIKDLESLNPGMKWDEQTNKLVPNQAVAIDSKPAK
jgi:phage shock protein A